MPSNWLRVKNTLGAPAGEATNNHFAMERIQMVICPRSCSPLKSLALHTYAVASGLMGSRFATGRIQTFEKIQT